ncbi:hypothetical protein T484DRAFT_1842437, partial [Baffinella frigidus]
MDVTLTIRYWKAKPEAFARDAMVFETLLQEQNPTVATSLRGAGVVPEAYAQKWFVGLCVHCMPYRHLATYVERYLEQGYGFVLRFGLALCRVLEKPLLSAGRDASRLLALLRLDVTLFPDVSDPDAAVITSAKSRGFEDVFAEILAGADATRDLPAFSVNRLAELRSKADVSLQ